VNIILKKTSERNKSLFFFENNIHLRLRGCWENTRRTPSIHLYKIPIDKTIEAIALVDFGDFGIDSSKVGEGFGGGSAL
jgi:hypothetical protein